MTAPESSSPLPPWFGLQVRSCFEQATSTLLRSKGYEEFLPALRSRRRWSDRVKEILVPLFPGYVFCRFDPYKRLPILTTPGVVSIVGFGGVPAPIRDQEIEAIQLMLDSSLPVHPHPFLAAGQRVRIDRGPLAGVEGVIVCVKKDFRLVASITMLQRSLSVEIDREWVEPIATPAAPLRTSHWPP